MKVTEELLQDMLYKNLVNRKIPNGDTRFFNITPNIKFYDWESDILFTDHRNFVFEFEIKTSVADFKADFKKTVKHQILANELMTDKPNYFYYLLPVGAASLEHEEIPAWAGLYEWFISEVDGIQILDMALRVPAPVLHTTACTIFEEKELNRAVYFKYWRQRVGNSNIKTPWN